MDKIKLTKLIKIEIYLWLLYFSDFAVVKRINKAPNVGNQINKLKIGISII